MGFLSPKEQEKPDSGPSMRRPGEAGIFEIAHAMAYFILPHYAFKDLRKAVDLWVQSPRTCPTFFYLTTCQIKKCESITEEATKFHAHTGKLNETHDFYLMEYPKPQPIDLTGWTQEQINEKKPVLAPYFSVIAAQRNDTTCGGYFVLGQAPTGGGATVRQIMADGKNTLIASGPIADASQFLSFVRGRIVT